MTVEIAPSFVQGVGIAALTAMSLELALKRCSDKYTEMLVTGLVLAAGLIVSMALPLRFAPGVTYDLGHVFLIIAPTFGGWIATLLTVVVAVAGRIYQGGAGTSAALIGIAVSSCLGIAFALLFKSRDLSARKLVAMGLAASVSIFSVFFLPTEIAFEFLEQAGLAMAIANLLGVLIVGSMLTGRRAQLYRERSLTEDTTTDPLTRLHNRRFFEDRGPDFARQALETYGSYAVMVIDVDNFKAINDTFGHARGDVVLRKIADMVKAQTRSTDLVARYGGEEIVVMVCDSVNIRDLAERIRQSIEGTAVLLGGIPLMVTVSVGYQIVRSFNITFEDAFERADAALYRAKDNGRNRVEYGRAA
ncbi:GGDEF domain-containing protein [Oricola cellulosilytica]|uniref:diguanylate cyclase n=1 Tax=Oricola cellulosilytica TaxID=1429082 RepID=A0A4R0P8T3_9HYPH|nr:diguanylate cyclase [Oricola cellulosilytica]TCD13493.1 diguanylate cyclase [Oricola cellulosilytica]